MSRSLFPSVRFFLALASLLAGLVALTGSAHASKSQESIIQDDRLLLGSGAGIQSDTLDKLQKLGVRTVHAVVNWRSIAPSPSSGSKPSTFTDTDSSTYPPGAWDLVDSLVRGANARGISLLLTPAGGAPNWALKCTAFEKRKYQKNAGTCRPDAKLYGNFVTAMAKRYSGTFPDPKSPGAALPKVSRWSIWNEPNLNSWITPQVISVRGNRVPVGAQIYRALVYAGGNALRANGHASDQILLGETAPIGLGTSRIAPVSFYQAVFCIDSAGHKLKGTAAKNIGCTGRYKTLPVTGVAHHPYTKGATQTLLAKQRPADITIANINRLQAVLRQGAKVRAVRSSMPIFVTEFGVSSRPPAAAGKGVPLARQADFINLFEYLAYLNPAVRSVCQFQFEDDSGLLTHTFQTGLETKTGAQKPAYAAYQVPVFVVKNGRGAKIWGGVRGMRSGTATILRNGKKLKIARISNGYFSPFSVPASGTYQVTTTTVATAAAPATTLTSRKAKAEAVVLPK